MTKYKHLMFDLDRTLWDMRTNHRIAFEELYTEFGFKSIFKCSFEEFYDAYQKINRSLWQEYQKQNISKEFLDVHRFSLTFDYFSIPAEKRCKIDDLRIFAQEAMIKQTHLIPFAMETLIWLQQKRYKMSIISNGFVESQYLKLERSGLSEFFDWIFLSEEIGVPKPQKEFFFHALKTSQCKAEECVVIGDDYIADIQGARQAGIDQIYFHENEKEHHRKATYHIRSLKELQSIL